MARKQHPSRPGSLVTLRHESKILRGNPLRDAHVRDVVAWIPHEAGESPRKRFPVLFDLVGFTGSGRSHLNWKPFSENLPERAARLVATKKMPPVIIVFPDCFTSLGGNQYVNSSAVGRYADYITRELVPFVDKHLPTLASRDHRGCFGKSSGGYGALLHGMTRSETWGAIASHSGDACFDFVYWCDWPNTLNELGKHRAKKRVAGAQDMRKLAASLDRGHDDGRVKRFLEAVWRKTKLSTAEGHALMNLCMAATYDADPKAPLGFRLPFNLETGECVPKAWDTWRASDPVNLVAKHAKALKSLRGLFIDCGWRDQYHIHYGARQLSRKLHAAGVPHRYEEFDDDHSDIDYRMDVSLPFLAKALR